MFNLINYVDEITDYNIVITEKDFGFPIEDFYYEIACFDFNRDGSKEIVMSAGNKVDKLLIYVFEMNYFAKTYEEQKPRVISSFEGITKAYVNENNEICIVKDNNYEEVYMYTGEKIYINE